MRYRWLEPDRPASPGAAGDEALLAALLARRGIATPAARDAFLAPRPTALADPFLLADLGRAIDRLGVARRERERIALYGDYDADGLTSTALLTRALAAMGFQVIPFVPHRVRDGYGLNCAIIDRLAAAGVTLLLAVDCGISNHREIAHAAALGLDTIVLDHHQVPATLPPAYAVVNPHRADCAYPFKDLAAVGLAYALIRALVQEGYSLRGRWEADEADLLELLDLVALGTIADVVPLREENRILVAWGLRALRETAHPGLRALVAVAGVAREALTAWHIAYVLAPRLNAAGRIAEPETALQLLLATTDDEALPLARQLDQCNRERQRELARIIAEATASVEQAGPLDDDRRFLQLDGAGWTAGVVGLVAGRLTEHYGRPVLVLERGDTVSKGSARSVDGFNIIEALRECDDLLSHYGGHAKAAGLTVPNEHLDALHQRLLTLAGERLSPEQLRPTLALDLDLPASRLSFALVELLAQLEPCGHGNPEPLLLVRDARVGDTRTSHDGKHLFFTLRRPGQPSVRGVAFGQGARARELASAPAIDLAGVLKRETWQGEDRLTFHARDFRGTVKS